MWFVDLYDNGMPTSSRRTTPATPTIGGGEKRDTKVRGDAICSRASCVGTYKGKVTLLYSTSSSWSRHSLLARAAPWAVEPLRIRI
mmetsp:Transcript_18822/g.37763  ORF Transcript_18822/g.37763 Transcript_18822/m.37763 type:complete len:86 (+) Transcript_18822:864-1121(+)